MAATNQTAEPGPAGAPPGAFYSLMGGKLGVSMIGSGEELASLVEKRLPATAVKALVRGGLSDAEVYQLILPRRTLAHNPPRNGNSVHRAEIAEDGFMVVFQAGPI